MIVFRCMGRDFPKLTLIFYLEQSGDKSANIWKTALSASFKVIVANASPWSRICSIPAAYSDILSLARQQRIAPWTWFLVKWYKRSSTCLYFSCYYAGPARMVEFGWTSSRPVHPPSILLSLICHWSWMNDLPIHGYQQAFRLGWPERPCGSEMMADRWMIR